MGKNGITGVEKRVLMHASARLADGARLESRQPGRTDRMVLSGPNNGDERWYVVDLSGSAWKDQAKTIDTAGKPPGGALGEIRRSLEAVKQGVDKFAGVAAEGGGPIHWIQPVNNTATGWKLGPSEMDAKADLAANSMKACYLEYFGTVSPKHVTIWADMSLDVKKKINASSAVKWVGALAQRGVHMQVLVGHGPRVFVTPDEVAAIYRASVVRGHSYLVLATKELQEPSDPGLFIPLME
eukprot:COSAG04_NODE_54_length_30630_cov_12.996233_1_plen_239_part_10